METVARNAGQALALHKTRRGSDLTSRSLALQELQDALGLDEAPLRIECYDVSHLQESDVVASMVVFEDGLARKSEYRRYVIKGQAGRAGSGGDVASIHEVISRRFRRYVEERAETGRSRAPPATPTRQARRYPPGSTRTRVGRSGSPTPRTSSWSTAAPPGRRGQRALDELGVDDVALCGLAKRLEEVWLPGEEHPVVLPRTSEGLYLLQRVRDEAHRFAITLHRSRRSKGMTASALDGVPGLGETRRTALLKHFGR
jgi:excinuclease ABC subunit C